MSANTKCRTRLNLATIQDMIPTDSHLCKRKYQDQIKRDYVLVELV